MEHLRSLENSNLTDEQKTKIINEISESFDTFLSSEGNGNILEVLNVFVNYLKNGDYQFFSESSTQKVKKFLLLYLQILIINTFKDEEDNLRNDTPPPNVRKHSSSC